MNSDGSRMIDGCLDGVLTAEERTAFAEWLRNDPENARRFAREAMLHDRLRNEFTAPRELMATLGDGAEAPQVEWPPPRLASRSPRSYGRRSLTAAAAASLVVLASLLVFWRGVGDSSASAAVSELRRILDVSGRTLDRTYQVAVEDASLPPPRADRRPQAELLRPPKPPMDGAVLHVRGDRQFVLVRRTREGASFVTGANGRVSWAVRPDGPVRVSSDLERFHRDLPGHEHAMPLISIHDGLERLLTAYDIELRPIGLDSEELPSSVEPSDEPAPDEVLRMLVAVRKPKYPGPRRVEITYVARSGLIRQLRFVDMPYGPERLTLRLTLVDELPLAAEFFDHESHHAPDRTVEIEE